MREFGKVWAVEWRGEKESVAKEGCEERRKKGVERDDIRD